MSKKIFFKFIFLFLFQNIFAQAQLFTDENMPTPLIKVKEEEMRNTPDTLGFGPAQPFFDDFSTGGQNINPNLWFLGGNHKEPNKSRFAGVLPPSVGVLTFDGLDATGTPYQTTFVSGEADVLESHYLNLSAITAGDSVIFSFYLQPQGKSEKPEVTDSFCVYFRANTGNYIKVYAKAGSALTPFKKIMIPVNNPLFFHTQFQIKMKSIGALYGHLDNWQVDYIYMGTSRSIIDSTHSDVAFSEVQGGPFGTYTAIPYQQFTGKTLMQPFTAVVNNLKNSFASPDIEAKITDPVGNSVFTTGNQATNTPLIPAYSEFQQPFNPFTDQNLNAYTSSYLLKLSLPADIDGVSGNNRYYEKMRVDSVFAYDDGEADGSYGIQDAPKGFGQKFNISSTDSIIAVWVCFAPRLNGNGNQTLYMDDYPFRLTIWDAPNPNSILYQQLIGTRVNYGDSLNYFHRYTFSHPISVSGDIWIGVQQIDYWPIGVGFDTHYDNRTKVYWDSVGNWVQSQVKGTLMIRPEFQNIQYNALPATAISSTFAEDTKISVYPNPLVSNQLQIQLPDNTANYEMIVRDMQGKICFTTFLQIRDNQSLSLEIPKEIVNGMYIIQHKIRTNSGREFVQTQKLAVQVN